MKTAASSVEPARTRARRLPPEERRRQLLDCALQVFARKGLGGARHTDVAAQAGVAISTVFFYFPTREDLESAVLDEVERFYVALAERIHSAGRPAPELLLAHAAAFAESVDDHADCARVWLDWSSAIRGHVWPRYLALEEQVVSILARTIERGRREGSLSTSAPPRDTARIMIGAAYLIVQMKLSGRPQAEVARFLDSLVRTLAGGLASNGGAGTDQSPSFPD